ncbi:hemerythrin domain-containing protein [Microtetraspora sp. AC03309]|uniref:hemerythrin domain-containing protein n=1 Tax=Microtetraspora sp. AC03309 TaxID=2779376 RepID=UPI001E30C376|nr:hemerythrin domain-containing protein [Microtetraspora sp. AC03309]
MGDLNSPAVRRRDLLGLSTVAMAGGVALAACGAPARTATAGAGAGATSPAPSSPGRESEVPVTPPEDLMREHGVLKRILLIYRNGIRRIDGGEQVPAQPLNAGARIIRDFIEEYHEHLEEQYVFPRLRKAGKLTDTVSVLQLQHRRGRVLTSRILEATAPSKVPDARGRRALVTDMAAFIRMYEPHEAREDTVVFPAFRDVVPPKEFLELGEVFEDEEHRRFGANGFAGVVDHVADIEKTLGIYDLAQFTPRV